MAQRVLEGELQEPQRHGRERQLQERVERMRAQWQEQRGVEQRQPAENGRQLQEQRGVEQRQPAENGRQLQEGRGLAQRQPAEFGRQFQEQWELLGGRRLADGVVIRRRGMVPEGIGNRQAFEEVANFVVDELGNGGAPRPRPDAGEWRIQREKTIRTLDELRKKLDTLCVGANYGKAAGNGAEIVGVGGTIVGAIMCFKGLPSGQTYMNAGNLLQNTGKLINGVSNGIELGISAKYLNDIEAVLKRDKELSEPLAEWLHFSRDLDANVQAIFGVSLASGQFINVMGAIQEFVNCYRPAADIRATLNLIKDGKYSMHIGTDVKIEKLQKLALILSDCPQLANKIRVTVSVLSSFAAGVQGLSDGAKIYSRMIDPSSSPVEPSLQNDLKPPIPTAGQVTGFCVFQSISMATSVISLINAASIIRHGKSKYSDAIEQLTRSLNWELRIMEE